MLFVSILSFLSSFLGSIISLLIGLILFLPGLSVYVRRLHDTDRSGWYYFIPLTIVGFGFIVVNFSDTGFAIFVLFASVSVAVILSLWWTIQRGSFDTNRYGPNPIEVTP